MKVLFVVNGFCFPGNGLSASARRTVKTLKDLGVDVRVLSQGNVDWSLPPVKIPVFNKLINKQGYNFAKSVKPTIKEALAWADVIHIEEPFWLEVVACRFAKRMNKPLVGTCHLYPENLFSSVYLRKEPYFNSSTMLFWRNTVFNKCKILQCPTEAVKKRLLKWGFKSELRVISNGLQIVENKPERKEHEIFTLVCTGRYSVEKDQITLLRALKYSKHSEDFKTILAGRGPKEKRLKSYADKLYKKGFISRPVNFVFCQSKEELDNIYTESDLYIHCATVEVEGLSCMEALSMGLVPVIAKAKLSSTSQFALSEQSLYKARKPKELARKIDWWFEHRDILEEQRHFYENLDRKYNIVDSAKELVKMYEDALK